MILENLALDAWNELVKSIPATSADVAHVTFPAAGGFGMQPQNDFKQKPDLGRVFDVAHAAIEGAFGRLSPTDQQTHQAAFEDVEDQLQRGGYITAEDGGTSTHKYCFVRRYLLPTKVVPGGTSTRGYRIKVPFNVSATTTNYSIVFRVPDDTGTGNLARLAELHSVVTKVTVAGAGPGYKFKVKQGELAVKADNNQKDTSGAPVVTLTFDLDGLEGPSVWSNPDAREVKIQVDSDGETSVTDDEHGNIEDWGT